MTKRYPLFDARRKKNRDDKLWKREKIRHKLYKTKLVYCPCEDCKGVKKCSPDTVFDHLIIHGRFDGCRVWRGPGDLDSSDEEWEAAWKADPVPKSTPFLRKDGGMKTQNMMQEVFQSIDAFFENEERLDNIIVSTLETTDTLMSEGSPMEGLIAEGHKGAVGAGCLVAEGETVGEEGAQTFAYEGDHNANQDGRTAQSGQDEGPYDTTNVEDIRALEDAMRHLFDGSENTQLSAAVAISNLKASHSCLTDKCADDMLAILQWMLPVGNCLPGSMWQVRRLTNRLGLSFENIHACPKGCVLYRLENKDLSYCPNFKCKEPRYRDMKNKVGARKVLRFFPTIPRLLRFYRTPCLSKLLRWYDENKSRDGKVRYPADSLAWKHLDSLSPEVLDTRVEGKKFGERATDVRVQISADGVCPFKLHRSTWSAWPVLTTLLNLPPWLSTKKFFMWLTLLIPGREQVPFEKFDVFMAPLIEEMQELWKGVPAMDVLQPQGQQAFILRAAVLYTSHDFPGYGTVSGASHQGYCACPPCGDQLKGRFSVEARKFVYRDARRWVRFDHYLRSSKMNELFDGMDEPRGKPTPKSPDEQQAALREYRQWLSRPKKKVASTCSTSTPETGVPTEGLGEGRSKGKRRGRILKLPDPSKTHGMKRDSLFYLLPYWRHLKLRHTLDPMHCEKNICENILKTICGQKDKDSVKVRRDMQREGIRKHLWMTRDPTNLSRMVKPAANYVLTPREFDIFCSRLEAVKVPSNYCSELGNAIRNKKFGALKSHDYHILMQALLPMALRGLMDNTTRTAIMRTCRVFRRLCSKTWDPTQTQSLQEDVAVTMTLMDMTFPPTFFDIMSHMPLHLVDELIILGPVHVRWMYPIERNMMALKGHVKNRARPEASMAHGYLQEETTGFVTSYLHGFDVVRCRVWDADPDDCNEFEVPEGGSTKFLLTRATRDKAHAYVLRNSTLTAPLYDQWEQMHDTAPGATAPLADWMKDTVHAMHLDMTDMNHADLLLLSSLPSLEAKRFARMKAYGNHWRVKDELTPTLVTYDCGVACIQGNERSARAGIDFVGELEDIVQLNYGRLNIPITLFFCQWKKRTDNRGRNTYVRDDDGFLVVNFKHNTPQTVDKFVFPSQCTSVFFSIDDSRPDGWMVVHRKEARARRVVEDDDDIFFSTHVEPVGLVPPQRFQRPPEEPSLVGAILLNDADNALALHAFGSTKRGDGLHKRKRTTQQKGTKPERARVKKRV